MSAARDVDELEAQALSLPIDARAALERRLLKSLEEVSEAEYEWLWGEESLRRAAESRPRANSGCIWRGGRSHG